MSGNMVAGFASDEMIDWESAKDSENQIEIPDVTGWKVLVTPLRVKNKSAGGVLIPEQTMDREQLVVSVGRVLQLGPLAYKNREDMKLNGTIEPWCKEGDIVGYGKYAGKKFLFKGFPFVILNDDEILMVFPSSTVSSDVETPDLLDDSYSKRL